MNVGHRRSLAKYLNGYRNLVDGKHAAGVQGFQRYFHRLAKNLPVLQESRRQRELREAPQFNIFRVLPVERREVLLHSPMLAHLLDPTGTHGQGHLFLRALFETAQKIPLFRPPANVEADDWLVRSEVYIGNGSIDLLVESPGQKYALLIENKIDALEQPGQLPRYNKWLCERRGDYSRQLVFLTPTGRVSDSGGRIAYIRMSYHRDIRELISRTIDEIKAPNVREMVREYQAILNDWAQEESQ